MADDPTRPGKGGKLIAGSLEFREFAGEMRGANNNAIVIDDFDRQTPTIFRIGWDSPGQLQLGATPSPINLTNITNNTLRIEASGRDIGLQVTGAITANYGGAADRIGTNATNQDLGDLAEDVDAPDTESGDVVVVDPEKDNKMIKSSQAYDSTVAGVISENPVFRIGQREGYKPLALAGLVLCKATTENGSIKRGDLLVTSSKPGFAMKADTDKIKPGMVLGKSLQELSEDEGKIVILVSLQ